MNLPLEIVNKIIMLNRPNYPYLPLLKEWINSIPVSEREDYNFYKYEVLYNKQDIFIVKVKSLYATLWGWKEERGWC